jgi:hydroxymethylbilane synthase
MSAVRIATRGSAQARTQSEHVASLIRRAHPHIDVELVFVETTGDRRQDVSLHSIGGQGVFVKEVQNAVLDGRADLAVHSAKDLPSATAEGLVIAAFGERRDPRDVLVGRSLDELGMGATVATGSVRRRTQLAARRPDLVFTELRGNIPTRLEKIPVDGAIVMAAAALEILGWSERIAESLDVDHMVPAVGQGAVAVECRVDDARVVELLGAVDHGETRRSVEIERAFLAELGSGCSLPIGGYDDGRRLRVFLASDDGRIHHHATIDTDPTGRSRDSLLDIARSAARDARRAVGG